MKSIKLKHCRFYCILMLSGYIMDGVLHNHLITQNNSLSHVNLSQRI